MSRLRGETHPNSKLIGKQVKEIRKLYKQGFSEKVIARNYRISVWNVMSIVEHRTWKHI